MMEAWERYITEEDRALLARGKWGQRLQPGLRPAVIAIDLQNYMVGPRGYLDDRYPYSCGESGWAAVEASKRIIRVARTCGVPVVYTRFALDPDGKDGGIFAQKVGRGQGEFTFLEGTYGAELIADIRPGRADLVIVKKKASAFLGLPSLPT